MVNTKQKDTITQFSHAHKAELERLLIASARLREVEDAVREYMRLLQKLECSPEVDKRESLICRSLYCFATVTYARCFNSGRQLQLRVDQIVSLTDADLKLHESLRTLRNQYFAHAVLEAEAEHLFCHTAYGETEPNGFTSIGVSLVGDTDATASQIMSLVGKLCTHVNSRIVELGDEVAKSFFGTNATWSSAYIGHVHRA